MMVGIGDGGGDDTERRPILKASRRVTRKKEFQRLQRTLIPSHYEIYIEPDYPECDTYKGITTIKIKVLEVTRLMTVNAFGVEILEATFEDETTKKIWRSVDILCDDENEIMTVEFDRGILQGEGTLSLLYAGNIGTNMKGFFRTSPDEEGGGGGYTFATQFEPTFARTAFPCFDEPNLKATFDISLVVPSTRIGLSNMPVATESAFDQSPDHFKILKFEKTPLMSTYLLGFVIGGWEVIGGTSKDGIPVNAYLPLGGKKEQGEFGLTVAIKALDFFVEYFGIPYPLPKLDLVTFPAFSSGAMENWGLITFRETVFLIDPSESSSIQKQWAATVIVSKIAQQWFGNLVTMSWWSELWLKEGFAAFMSYFAIDSIFPEFGIWTQFATDDMIPGLELDALSSSHPVEVEIRDPGDIGQVFDRISLSKGASVLSMLEKYMGRELFRKGLKTYLTAYAYKNVMTWQFWETLEVSTGLPILKLCKTWTDQKGFPLIKIADLEQKKEGRAITLTQEKYTADAKYSGNKVEFGGYAWVIPVAFTKGSSPNSTTHVLMDGTESCIMDFVIPDVTPKEWLKVNGLMSGFFRVHYPKAMMREYLYPIRNRTMAPLDRLNLLDDLYALVKCGETHTVELLRLLESYVNEDDFNVWEGMSRVLGGLKDMIEFTDDLTPAFYNYARNLLRPLKSRLGWDPVPEEGHLKGMLRSSLLVRLVSVDDEETIEEGKERFLAHIHNKDTPLPPDLRSPAYRAALATGEEEVYDALISLYRDSDWLEEKIRILRALGSTDECDFMIRTLSFILSEEVMAQDMLPVLLNMAGSKEGRETAWEFVKINFQFFKDKFPVGGLLSGFLKELLQGFCSEEMAVDVETFFKENPIRGTERSVGQAVESIRGNSEWRRRDTNSIRHFLNAPPAEVVTID